MPSVITIALRQRTDVPSRDPSRSHPGVFVSRSVHGLAGLVLLVVVLAPAYSVARDYDPRDLVSAALEVYNERVDDPLPFLTGEQVDRLVAGDVIRVRRRDPNTDDAPERVTGFVLLHRPRIAVWLAALDPEFPANPLLTEKRLSKDDQGHSTWYQHVDLPWPLTDRHWVIDLGKDLDLARSTEGFVWVHRWSLAPDGRERARETLRAGLGDLTLEDYDKAIYLPENEGAWILFALDEDLTLLAYRVRTVIGGGIPDSWIATFAMAQLEGLLREVDAMAENSVAEYDPATYPVYDGLGRLIPSAASPE